MPDRETEHDPSDDFSPVNLAGYRLPIRDRAIGNWPELYQGEKEVLLPLGATLRAVIPCEFERGEPVSWRRIEGMIVDRYAVETPCGGGPAQAWYCVDGREGGWLVQTRHIREYALPEEEEPYIPIVEQERDF